MQVPLHGPVSDLWGFLLSSNCLEAGGSGAWRDPQPLEQPPCRPQRAEAVTLHMLTPGCILRTSRDGSGRKTGAVGRQEGGVPTRARPYSDRNFPTSPVGSATPLTFSEAPMTLDRLYPLHAEWRVQVRFQVVPAAPEPGHCLPKDKGQLTGAEPFSICSSDLLARCEVNLGQGLLQWHLTVSHGITGS
jgi:hypothetical protein